MIDTKHENAIKVKEWFGKSYLERSLIINKGESNEENIECLCT